MTDAKIGDIIEEFVAAARRAQQAGFDGVQVLNLFRDEAEDKARSAGMWFDEPCSSPIPMNSVFSASMPRLARLMQRACLYGMALPPR